jgi:hypothetical protein
MSTVEVLRSNLMQGYYEIKESKELNNKQPYRKWKHVEKTHLKMKSVAHVFKIG